VRHRPPTGTAPGTGDLLQSLRLPGKPCDHDNALRVIAAGRARRRTLGFGSGKGQEATRILTGATLENAASGYIPAQV